jgi:PIN domain nuclease of toxin-antitoxin system
VNLLLDTHTFLWHANNDPQISSKATAHVIDPSNDLFLSMASVWEIAIKAGLGKLSLATPFITFMTRAIGGYGLTALPISQEDCAGYEQLSFPDPQHRDPFDRMIVIHALRNGLTLVGVDRTFDNYGVPRVW